MTPQENQVLQDFLTQLTQARGIAKDPQADALIASAVAQQPDAAYLLVQRALMMEQALNSAKVQIAQLQNELQTARTPTNTGFLDSASWGRSAADTPRPAAMPAYTASAPQPVAPAPMPAAAKPGFFSGGAGGFLGNVAATAAGVAGGALLFQGVESLFGHHNSGNGFLGGHSAGALPVENTTINNYYAADNSTADNDILDAAGNDDSDDDGLTSI